MTRDEEALAAALMIRKQHGEGAPVYVAEQIGAQAVIGDQAGVARWLEIATALTTILKPPH